MSKEREALEDLVTSPGWLLFKEHVRQKWGDEGYGKQLSAVMARYTDDPLALGQELRKVQTAMEEVNVLIKWPDDQIKRSDPVPHIAALHRGGR